MLSYLYSSNNTYKFRLQTPVVGYLKEYVQWSNIL